MSPSDPCPVPFERSLAAIRAEGRALDDVLVDLPDRWWVRATRLPAWDLGQLLAHTLRAPTRVTAYLDQPEPGVAELDWLDYWRRANDTDPAGVAQRAIRDASDRDPDELPEAFSNAWRDAVAAAGEVGAARLLPGPFGAMRLDHYLTTRVLELTVHGLDVRAALGLPEVPTADGTAVTVAVLEALRGSSGDRPSDRDEDDLAFILAATGRREHPDPDLPVIR